VASEGEVKGTSPIAPSRQGGQSAVQWGVSVVQRILVILACLAIIMFAWSNTHHVEVGLAVGRPVQVRLIFLLLTTFLLGHFTAVLLKAYVRGRIGSEASREKTAHDDEEDEFIVY
jgi:uncharacterized integral membrane protein